MTKLNWNKANQSKAIREKGCVDINTEFVHEGLSRSEKQFVRIENADSGLTSARKLTSKGITPQKKKKLTKGQKFHHLVTEINEFLAAYNNASLWLTKNRISYFETLKRRIISSEKTLLDKTSNELFNDALETILNFDSDQYLIKCIEKRTSLIQKIEFNICTKQDKISLLKELYNLLQTLSTSEIHDKNPVISSAKLLLDFDSLRKIGALKKL